MLQYFLYHNCFNHNHFNYNRLNRNRFNFKLIFFAFDGESIVR